MNENRFKKIRLWKGLSVKETADALKLSVGTVSAIENGRRDSSPEIRAAYAKTFPLDESYFSFLSSYQKMDEDYHDINVSQI